MRIGEYGVTSRKGTRAVRIFPNWKACLRLVTSLAVEQSDEWVSGKRYLNMEELSEFDIKSNNKKLDLIAIS